MLRPAARTSDLPDRMDDSTSRSSGGWPADLPVIAFGLAAANAVRHAHDAVSAWRTIAWVIGCSVLAVGIARLGQSRRGWRITSASLVAAGTLLASYFALQYSYLSVEAKIPIIDAIGRGASALSPRLGWWAPHSNTVATFLEGVLLLAAGMTIDARGRTRAAVATATVIVALGLLLTMSRGAWVGVGAGAAAWWVVARVSSRGRPAIAGFT